MQGRIEPIGRGGIVNESSALRSHLWLKRFLGRQPRGDAECWGRFSAAPEDVSEGPPLTARRLILHDPNRASSALLSSTLPYSRAGKEKSFCSEESKLRFHTSAFLTSPIATRATWWQRQKAQGPAHRKCGGCQVFIRHRALYAGTLYNRTTCWRHGGARGSAGLSRAACRPRGAAHSRVRRRCRSRPPPPVKAGNAPPRQAPLEESFPALPALTGAPGRGCDPGCRLSAPSWALGAVWRFLPQPWQRPGHARGRLRRRCCARSAVGRERRRLSAVGGGGSAPPDGHKAVGPSGALRPQSCVGWAGRRHPAPWWARPGLWGPRRVDSWDWKAISLVIILFLQFCGFFL